MEAASPVKGLAYGAIASMVAEIGPTEVEMVWTTDARQMGAVSDVDRGMRFDLQDRTRMHTGHVLHSIVLKATMPVDVVKVRMQFAGADGAKVYDGISDCIMKTAKAEGPFAFWRGVQPALVRQCFYGGLRYGLYAPIRDSIGVAPGTPKSEIPLMKKIIAGGSAGAIASFICVPCDLMKVRLQVDGMVAGSVRKYSGMSDCIRQIYGERGLKGMWRGSGPTIGRATVLAAVEMSSYDEIKTRLIKMGVIEDKTASGVFTCAVASGFFCAVFSSPFDVVKSRVMGQPVGPDGNGKLYKGMVDCFVKSTRNEGITSLWKGFFPNWARLGPRGVICFLVMEGLNSHIG